MIERVLKNYLQPPENYIWGFADLRGLLAPKFHDFGYGISIGLRLDNDIIEKISDGPTPEYYNHYRNANSELLRLTTAIVADLENNGIRSLAVSPTISTKDLESAYRKTLRTDISHKMIATRAGLGWIGKTDLLISRRFGPRLRLASILLKDDPGNISDPVNRSRCGNCRACIDACPADAGNGLKWDISVDRDEFYNAWKCHDQCVEFGKTRLSMDASICGICVRACPVGQGTQYPDER
jgi:epoxyqueuosine reductase